MVLIKTTLDYSQLSLQLANISSFSAWVPLIAWGYTQERMKQHSLRVSPSLLNWLAGYFLLSALSDALGFILAELGIHNLWLFRLFFLLQFPLALILYRKTLLPIPNYWFWGLGIGFGLFAILDYWLWHPIVAHNYLVTGVVFTGFSLYYFYRLPKTQVPGERTLAFWMNVAFLLYFGGSIILFSKVDQIWADPTQIYVWGLHALLNILKGLLVAIGMVLIPKRMRIS